jgi:hypothetical protein
MKLDSASDPRLKTFLDTFKSGSQAPEPAGVPWGILGRDPNVRLSLCLVQRLYPNRQ